MTRTPVSDVFNEDCMIGMARYPDGFFDLGIVDPPYGGRMMKKNKYQRHGTTDSTYRNEAIPGPKYFSELYRVSKNSIIWGCQYMMPFLNPDGSFIIWDKGADPDLHNMSAVDVAWYSKRQRIRKFVGAWCGAVKCEVEPTIHIHQKPVKLYKWQLKHYALPGFKILDTHMGSQSLRIAAFIMGFDYYGWEIDEKHFNDGNARFKEQTAQLSIL